MTTPIDSSSARPSRRRARSKPASADTKADAGSRQPIGDAHFRRLAESSKDVFWLADLDAKRLLYVSPRVEALWGVAPAALLDDPSQWNQAVAVEDAERLPQPFFAEAPADDETVREYRIVGRDGRTRWIRDRRFALRDGNGGTRVGGIAEDITERKQRELDNQALLDRERRARAAAEAATQAKDEFLAVVTHELRSPLNAIRGWSHVLRHSSALQPVQVKALDSIDRNTQAQAHLVDDLLDSQRILCGTLQLDLGRVPLSVLVEEATESVRPAAQLKRIRLEASHDPGISMVMADADRLRQAMTKLLSNAVKFTPEDGIVGVASRRSGDGGVAIEVRDTGVGIEASQLPQLFERFQQADSSNARRANGLGLGLTLAQQLVELHGGRIAVHSEGIGHGSVFTIELPPEVVCEDSAAEGARLADSPLAGKRIVIVEDDADGREVLGLILRNAQVQLQSFDRAAAAYEYLAHASEGERPDALISDIAMPDEDGYAFIRRVREMEGGEHRPHVVALALTSFARVEDRIRALKAGFDAHVAKPIDPERVLRTLVQALGANGAKPLPA